MADDSETSAKDAAQLRWMAVEGFNSFADLSPSARRLGIELVCRMDATTRECFPSELFLASRLGLHISAIKKAKAELKKHGLIDWENPEGRRSVSCTYSFNWTKLLRESQASNGLARVEVAKAREERKSGRRAFLSTRTGTIEADQSTRTGTMERGSKYPKGEVLSTQNEVLSTHTGTGIVPTRVPDITHDIAQVDIAQLNTEQNAPGCVTRDITVQPHEGKDQSQVDTKARGIEAPAARPRFTCHYPTLIEVFKDQQDVLSAIADLDVGRQAQADKLRAMKGPPAARAYILEQSMVAA